MKTKILPFLKTKFFIVSAIVIMVFSFSFLYNSFAKRYVDSSLKNAASSYLITRGINAMVSIIQHSTLNGSVSLLGSVGITAAAGEIVDPIKDATERFADLLTLSIWTLGAEKILFELSNLKGFVVFIILLALLNVFLRSNYLNKFLFLMLLLKIFIPISAFVSYYADKYYFSPQIKKTENNLRPFSKTQQIIPDSNEGTFTSIKNTVISVGSKIKRYFQFYFIHRNEIVDNLINLGALYLSKLLLNILILPLIFLFAAKNVKLE